MRKRRKVNMHRIARNTSVAAVLVATLMIGRSRRPPSLSGRAKVSATRVLGATSTYNVSKLGKPRKSYVNQQYKIAGKTRTVYVYCWGNCLDGSDGEDKRYPLKMYALKSADGSKTTFNFTSYRGYPTTKGIAVGSSEGALKKAYGSALRKLAETSTYRYYRLGSGPYTEFAVRGGRVFSITVRK